MALDLGSASATITLNANDFINNAKSAGNAIQGLQNETNSLSGNGGFLNWVTANEAALSRWGKGMLAVGGIITGAFAAPIIAGSRAAWGQVDAVEQATIAMNAYADSTEQVDTVLADLLAYARSDMGVLFSRQELFSAAQSMLIYGASIEDVTGYTEILSRSVGLGLSDWDSLNTIIGRVGSTGRLTGNDFDMLKQRGFDLDESLRNTNITWEELFVALDKGIPADALAGQADTIRGKSIRLQSALRGLGLAFLGVDSETSKFIEGGLGWQMMRGLERVTEGLKRMAPAVGRLGDIFASIVRPIGMVFDFLLRLPAPIQTGILLFTALSGAALTAGGSFLLLLPRIASTIDALGKMGMGFGLLTNPVVLAVAAVAALAAGFVYLYTQSEAFREMIHAIGRALDTLTGGAISAAIAKVQELYEIFQLVFGEPVTNTATLEVGALLDVPYSDWVEMPDGTWKNATLGLTATGSGIGIISWVADPESPDGKTWTLTVDTDGDGKDEALTIIASEDHKDGTYTLTAEYVDDTGEVKTFTAWYDANSGKTIILDMDAAGAIEEMEKTRDEMTALELKADNVRTKLMGMYGILQLGSLGVARAFEAVTNILIIFNDEISKVGRFIEDVAKRFSDFVGPLGDVGTHLGIIKDIITGDWGSIDWRDILDVLGLEAAIPLIEATISGLEKLNELTGPAVKIDPLAMRMRGDIGGGMARDEVQSSLPSDAGDVGNLAGRIAAVTEAYRLAEPAVTGFSNAIAGTQAPMQQSTIDMNKMASTAPIMGGSMQSADTQVKGAGAGISSTFQNIAASALANFPAAQAAATSQMGTLASNAASQALTAQTNVTSQFSTMSTNTAAKFLGMKASAAVQMALMASTATTQGNNTMSNMVGAIAGGMARVTVALMAVPRAVSSVGGTAVSTAYSIGANISSSFASGMWAFMGQIAAAAAQMVATADAALRAKARIASPSKVFQALGGYVGEGFELGIRNSIPDIARAADAMLNTGMPSPVFSAPLTGAYGGYGGGTTVIDNSKIEYRYFSESDLKHMLETAESAPARTIQALRDARSDVRG